MRLQVRSLGWGLPGAMGVKCALPDRPVLCFTGDGGMYYHMTELETAIEWLRTTEQTAVLQQAEDLLARSEDGLRADQLAQGARAALRGRQAGSAARRVRRRQHGQRRRVLQPMRLSLIHI